MRASSSPRRSERVLSQLKKRYPPDQAADLFKKIDALASIDLLWVQDEISLLAAGKKQLSGVIWDSDTFPRTGVHPSLALKEKDLVSAWKNRLMQIHDQIVPDPDRIGGTPRFREVTVVDRGITTPYTSNEMAAINDNPYLGFNLLRTAGPDRSFGQVLYPNAKSIGEKLLMRIKNENPSLHRKLLSSHSARSGSRQSRTLNSELVDHLVSQRLGQFFDQMKNLKESVQPKAAVEIAADLYYDLISIHPFDNGNGRSLRQFVFRDLLSQYKIDSPLLVDVNLDYSLSRAQFKELIVEAYERGQALYQDLETRLIANRDIEPAFKNLVIDQGKSAEDLAAFERLQNEAAIDFHQDWSKPYENSYQPIPVESVNQYLKLDTSPRKLWKDSELIYRGFPILDHRLNDFQIVRMFQKIRPDFTSVHLRSKLRGGERGQELAQKIGEEIEKYNKDLRRGQFLKMMKSHSYMQGEYKDSYGLSFSRSPIVAKAFAMGASTVGPYGRAHDLPKLLTFQKEVKDRLVIVIERGKHDLDLAGVKQTHSGFAPRYDFLREVVVIGGVDPNRVVMVKRIDPKGNIVETYFRNPKNPGEIIKVKGDIHLFAAVPKKKDLQDAKTFRIGPD